MTAKVIRTVPELAALSDEWQTLLDASAARTIFLTPDWMLAWLDVHDVAPLVVSIRDESGRLIGLAPHYIAEYGLVQVVRYRVLRMLGDTDCGAEYQTWIARAGNEARVHVEIARTLARMQGEWDLAWMPRLNAWTGAGEPLVDALRAEGFLVNTRPGVFSAIALPERFDAYLARLSANRRQQVRRMSRRILGMPGTDIRKVRTEDELEPALDALFALHGKRWQAVGEQGAFVKRPREKAFYQRFARRALERGWLALYVLSADGEPKAAQIGYVYGDAFLQLQEGFDPEFSPHVGNVLRAHVIEDCIAQGLREYDFLGGITDHKRRWLAEERFGADVLVAVPRLKNMPVVRGGVWPTGRYLRPRGAVAASA